MSSRPLVICVSLLSMLTSMLDPVVRDECQLCSTRMMSQFAHNSAMLNLDNDERQTKDEDTLEICKTSN